MKAGDLRQSISFARMVAATDSKGNRRTVPQTFATCMAMVTDVSGRDFYAAQANQAQDIVTFGIRWREDVDTEHRLIFGGQTYKIEEINHLGYRRDFMQIKARLTRGEGA